jgi:hypothetical protein
LKAHHVFRRRPIMFTHLLLSAWLASCTADAVSTHIALQRGAYEANPLAPSDAWTNNAMSAGEVGLGIYLWKKHPEHRKLVVAAMVVSTVAHGWAAAYNIKQQIR